MAEDLPKTIVWARQVVEGVGHRNFFLWRARNREQHMHEAYCFALEDAMRLGYARCLKRASA